MEYVADANVFIHGRGQYPFESAVTTPSVAEELRSQKARLNFDIEDVVVEEPGEEARDEVLEKARDINSPTSDADEELLALAMERGARLVTDDKALQNLASHMGVEFESFLSDEIVAERQWKRVCENCGAEVEGEECGRCGSSRFLLKPG